jgi:hypothetical protein
MVETDSINEELDTGQGLCEVERGYQIDYSCRTIWKDRRASNFGRGINPDKVCDLITM